MKFAHAFTEQLQSSEYPAEWLDAAIRYRQLKKCIKKVQRELAELGLTADMLKMLAGEKGAGNEPTTLGSITTVITNSCTPEEFTSEVEGNFLLREGGSHCSKSSSSSVETSSVESAEFDEKETPETVVTEEPPKQAITFSYLFHGLSPLSLSILNWEILLNTLPFFLQGSM